MTLSVRRRRRARSRTIGFLVVVFVVLPLFGASQALAATTRYAVPGGTGLDPSCTSKAANCSLAHAIEDVAQTGDEVIVATGTYALGSSGVTEGNPALNIHGEDGQPAPVIVGNLIGHVLGSCLCVGDGTVFRHLRVENDGSGDALYLIGGTSTNLQVDDVEAITRNGGTAIAVSNYDTGIHGTTIRDTTAFVSNGAGTAIYSAANLLLRNVTAVAPDGGGIGLSQNPYNSTDMSAVVRNSILHGGSSGGTDIRTNSVSNKYGHVDLDYSNYATIINCAGGCTLTSPGLAHNQTVPPYLTNEGGGDFHELSGSPTIDAGQDSPDNGTADPAGNPRFLGSAPDIGAFEYVPPGTTVTPPPPPPPPPPVSPAVLQQSSGVSLNFSVLIVKGKYVTIPISCSALVSGNCVGNITLETASKVLVKPSAAAQKHKLTIGKANFSVPSGRTKNVKLKVSKPALMLLKKKGKVKAIAKLTVTANGLTRKSTKKVTLKRKH